MLVVILIALLAQKGRMARALDAGVSTWQAAKEYRPIPQELRNVAEVVMAKGAVINIGSVVASSRHAHSVRTPQTIHGG